MRIGIDVGGTHTDAVVMRGGRVVAAVKRATSEDVTSGIRGALHDLDARLGSDRRDIEAIMIGTTHFMNALVEASGLAPTAVVRLGLPATSLLPPFVGWPPRLVRAVRGTAYLAHGGHEFDGREIAPIDPDELRRHAADIATRGIGAIAISSVFSPINADVEMEAREILSGELGRDVVFSLSHEFGRIGLLERENATIINAALLPLADRLMSDLVSSFRQDGVHAPLYVSQNDGTLMGLERARRYPVATFASGPTNSMRGASVLSGRDSCTVVDVGGTTTDIGVVTQGFPRQAGDEVALAGIRTSMRMPDVFSIATGGGSVVSDGGARVGPRSVGHHLERDSLAFGGDVFTATDAAVVVGRIALGDAALARRASTADAERALRVVVERISEAIEQMQTSMTPLPVVAVGGGAILLPEELPGLGAVERPEDFSVANAVGAAIAQVSGEVDKIYALVDGRSESVLDTARQEAVDRAIAAGADPRTVEIVDLDKIPIPYLPGNATRIRVRAVGNLALDGV